MIRLNASYPNRSCVRRSITGVRLLGRWKRLIQRAADFDQDLLIALTGIADLAGTAIRHAQLFEQLQAAHQRYQELFEDSIDPILITNWNGEILEVNRKAVLASDYSKDILRSMRIDQLHQIDLDLVGKELWSSSILVTPCRMNRGYALPVGMTVPIQVYVREIQTEELSQAAMDFTRYHRAKEAGYTYAMI